MISKKAAVKAAANAKIGHLVNYLLDSKGKSDRVAAVAVTNCQSDDPGWAVHEMQAVQSRNQRAKGGRTYHLVVSFRDGENVPNEVLAQIEDQFCRALGFNEHQRVSVVHRDTDNLHLHVAINKVHPKTFTLHEPFNDYHTRAKLCRLFETRYGLEPDGAGAKRHLRPTHHKAASMERIGGVESLIGYVQRSLGAAVASAQSWEDVHEAFARAGVALKERGSGLIVESNGKRAKASSCWRELSKKALERRFGPYRESGQSAEVSTQEKTYSARPLQQGSAKLYGQYQAHRTEAKRTQSARLAEALAAHRQRVQHAQTAYKVQRTIIGLTRRGTVNTIMLQLHRANLKAKVAASFASYRAERSDIYRETKLLAWNDWLMTQAANGNESARALLQSRRPAAQLPPPLPVRNFPRRIPKQSHARPDYQKPGLAKASGNVRPDYHRSGIHRAALPARPDYTNRPSAAARIVGRAAALLQSGLGRLGGRGPARPLAGVRDLSRVDVVYDQPGTEVLLRAHEPHRLGSEIGGDPDPAMRRAGNGTLGIGGQVGEGESQGRGKSQAEKLVSHASATPYATRRGTVRGVVQTTVRLIERAKEWTSER